MTSPKSSVDKHSARYDFKRSFIRLIAPGIVSLLFSIIYFIAIPVATISSAGTYSLSLRAENIASIRKQLACALFGNTTSNFVFFNHISFLSTHLLKKFATSFMTSSRLSSFRTSWRASL